MSASALRETTPTWSVQTMATGFAHNSVGQQFGLCSAKWVAGWNQLNALVRLRSTGRWAGGGNPWRSRVRGLCLLLRASLSLSHAAEQGCERKLPGLVSPRLRAARCHCLWTKVSHRLAQTQGGRGEQSPHLDRRRCGDGGCAACTVASELERRAGLWCGHRGWTLHVVPSARGNDLSGKDLI